MTTSLHYGILIIVHVQKETKTLHVKLILMIAKRLHSLNYVKVDHINKYNNFFDR